MRKKYCNLIAYFLNVYASNFFKKTYKLAYFENKLINQTKIFNQNRL